MPDTQPRRNRTLVSTGELRSDHLRVLDPSASGMDVLTAPPGLLASHWDGLGPLCENPTRKLSAAQAFAWRGIALAEFARAIDALEHSEEWEDAIIRWLQALSSGDLRVFCYTKYALFSRFISKPEETVFCPGPITRLSAELGPRRELKLVLRGDQHESARAFFHDLQAESEDISAQISALLAGSWAGDLLDPEDIYYKVLCEYFATSLDSEYTERDEDNPLLAVMTDFQRDAYKQAKGILRHHGGVFLADVVGLGKTFIAIALLKHLQDQYHEHAVVVAPPAVLPAWKELAQEFHIKLQLVSYGKLEALEDLRDREILVVDESHNFRTPGTLRQQRLLDWLRPAGDRSTKKVLLLSATPQNNRPRDVLEQLRLFPDTYKPLHPEGESLDDYFEQVDRGGQSLKSLLQRIVIRRTRNFIRAAYPNTTLRLQTSTGDYVDAPLRFPTRVAGPEQALRYNIDHTYPGGLYDKVLGAIREMTMPRQSLAKFILPRHASDSRLVGIRRVAGSLRGLFKALLLKRVESSVYALQQTLRRSRERLDAMLQELERGELSVRVSPLAQSTADDNDFSDWEDRTVEAHLFDTAALRAAVLHDIDLIDQLLLGIGAIGPAQDAKLHRLERYLEERSPRMHKTIVFTQFAETADYLGEHLGQRFGATAVATGRKGKPLRLAQRFAPCANRVTLEDGDELDLLISTDALSEGVNLQDGDTLVNYDLHWNPVRLIQRAGRIDRIGSDNEEIHIASFLPECGLGVHLKIEDVIRDRVADFMRVFGDDFHVLPDEEKIEVDGVLEAYSGAAFERADAEDDVDGLSRHFTRISDLRQSDPTRFAHIRALRPGRRALSSSPRPSIAVLRAGYNWRFYATGHSGSDIFPVDDRVALDWLYAHAQAGRFTHENIATELMCLRDLAQSASDRFEPEAERLRLQRSRPRLEAAEDWVLATLHRHVEQAPECEPEIESIREWIRRGRYKQHLLKVARHWKRERLSPISVFSEMTRLLRMYPIGEEVLSDELQIVGVMGSSDRR